MPIASRPAQMKRPSTSAQMKDVTPGSIEGGRRCMARRDYTGPKKFAEPVSLSSTVSADLPLPGTALRSGFVLLALRARRKQHTNVSSKRVKGSKSAMSANCAVFLFQHCNSHSCNMKRVQKRKSRHLGGTKKIRRA